MSSAVMSSLRAVCSKMVGASRSMILPPESKLSSLSPGQQTTLFGLFSGSLLEDKNHGPARHQFAEAAVRTARYSNADFQWFLVLKLQSELELGSVTAVSETKALISPETIDSDPRVKAMIAEVDNILEQNQIENDLSTKEAEANNVVSHADVLDIEEKFSDVAEKGLEHINHVTDHQIREIKSTMKQIASLGTERIQAATALKFDVPYAMLHDMFRGVPPEEAARIAMVFDSIDVHTSNDPGVVDVGNLYKMENAFDAYRLMVKLGHKLKSKHPAQIEDVLDTLFEVHESVTKAYRYRKLDDGSYTLLPASAVRKKALASRDLGYCHPDKIPGALVAFAEKLIASANSNRMSSTAAAGWIHQHVIAIHPFDDGNGRTTRMMSTLFGLMQDNIVLGIHGGARKQDYKEANYKAEGLNRIEPTRQKLQIQPLVEVFADHTMDQALSLYNRAREVDVEAVKARKCSPEQLILPRDTVPVNDAVLQKLKDGTQSESPAELRGARPSLLAAAESDFGCKTVMRALEQLKSEATYTSLPAENPENKIPARPVPVEPRDAIMAALNRRG